MKTSQAKAIQESITDLVSLVEEQFLYQNILFEQINSISCPDSDTFEIDEDCFECSIRYASERLQGRQAAEHMVKVVSERYERVLRRVAELAFLGERNRDYYVDRVYCESKKIQELITADNLKHGTACKAVP